MDATQKVSRRGDARHKRAAEVCLNLPLWVAALITFLSLPGCAIGPNYRRPALSLPAQFRDSPAGASNSIGDLPWWAMFKDQTLHGLIQETLTNNYDLRRAVARVEQARAIAAQSRALFFPQINYQAEAMRGKNTAGSAPIPTGGQTVNTFLFGGSTAWELDLWGRIRRLNEAGRAQFFAQEEARRDLMITVLSDVATTYYELLALDAELAIARRTTNAFAQSLGIFSERLQGGIASRLETAAAEAALASAAATVPELERQIALHENQLSILAGRNPGPIARRSTFLQEQLPPEVPPGLPSELLARRPDIRAAEERLRAANADVGVAIANFLPRLSLTGFYGQVSPELATLTSGAANAWNIAAPITGPLFQGGQLLARYRQALANREEARLAYQSTVLNALQEVSNALISRQRFEEARVQHARAVDAYTVAVQVATERYVAGRASYYEVLQEQQLLFPAENALVENELNQFLAVIQLYRALGGGWLSEPLAGGPAVIPAGNRVQDRGVDLPLRH